MQSQFMRGPEPTVSKRRPTHLIVPWLLGLALSFYGVSTIERFEDLLHPSPSLSHVATLAILFSVAIGIWLPNRFAMLFARLASLHRRKYRSAPWDDHQPPAKQLKSCDPMESRHADHETETHLKTTAAACMVLSGISMMVCSSLAGQLATLYHQTFEAFHWTSLTSCLLDFSFLLIYVGIPTGLLGIAINGTQRTTLFHSHRLGIAIASLLFGLACGLLVWSLCSGFPSRFATLLTALLLLIAGALHAQPSKEATILSSDSLNLPALTSRWRFILVWMLAAAGFLLMRYLAVWQSFHIGPPPWYCTPTFVLCIAIGLAASTHAYSQFLRPLHNIAVLCIVISVSITAVTILQGHSGRLYLTDDYAFWSISTLIWLPVSFPVLLIGLALGSASAAAVERVSRPATGLLSASLAICFGAGLASLTLMADIPAQLTSFHLLVVIILAWLAIGGLLLIYEPRFRLQRRWPQATFLLGSLVLLTLALPRQAQPWSELLRTRPTVYSIGQMENVTNPLEAEKLLANTRLQRGQWVTMDDIFQKLRLSKERYAAIALTLPSAPWKSMSPKMQAAVTRIIYDKLQPDGVFQTRFDQGPEHSRAIEQWQRKIEKIFNHVEAHPMRHAFEGSERRRWCVVAYRNAKALDRNESTLTGQHAPISGSE